MSELSEYEFINRFLINIQQVFYIIDFKINQETLTRSLNFVNELKTSFQ